MSAWGSTLRALLGPEGWSIDPVALTGCVLLATLYLWGLVHVRHWPLWRTLSYLCGVGMIAVALMSGVDSWSDRLLSIHMVQHLLLLFLAPTLLLYGAPARLSLKALPPPARRRLGRALVHPIVRRLSHPVTGVTLFTAVVLYTHVSGEFEAALRNETIHQLEHAAYFISGLILLAPLIAADPLPHPPGPVTRFSALMLAMTPMVAVSVVLITARTVRYPYYIGPAHAFGASALADQHFAGIVMWFGGGLPMGVLAVVLTCAGMVSEERRQRRREAVAARNGSGPLVPAGTRAAPSVTTTEPA